MAHSDDATKKLEKAIPTTNSDGKVIKWDITYSYDKNDYKVEYSHEVHQTEEGDEKFTLQIPGSFTQASLVALLPLSHWNEIYNSQYGSIHPETEPAVETINSDFDVTTLSAS
ncbi:hypothetical protein OAE88_00310 [bacterium]|nr:hypothetical protein [bacterium]